VQPFGAQILTRVGRSDNPDSSMKTISRRSAAHLFFERGQGLALPRQHGLVVALDGSSLGFLRAEAHRAEQPPDMDLAEAHAVQPFDEGPHPFEGPQLGAEAVGNSALQQPRTQRVELLGVELPRTTRGHRAQGLDAAFIKPGLPRVRRLPCHAHRAGRLRGRLASQHQPSSAHHACAWLRPSWPCTDSPITLMIG